jgi:hypothetical protein
LRGEGFLDERRNKTQSVFAKEIKIHVACRKLFTEIHVKELINKKFNENSMPFFSRFIFLFFWAFLGEGSKNTP